MIHRRSFELELISSLAEEPSVAILGPRQVGKTTIALEIGRQTPFIYLDLESPYDVAKLADPQLFFDSNQHLLVILDEIQRRPDLFPVLRGVIDRGRRENRATNRFLMLGSASLELLKQYGESLAGRIRFLELPPLQPAELASSGIPQDTNWLRGGFPLSLLAPSDATSLRRRMDFVRTYLEREIPFFSPRLPSAALSRLWTLLAHNQGGILNSAELGRTLELSSQTINRYLDLLVDLYLLRRLPPFHVNIGKRLVKSPKVYLRDSGIVHALLNLPTMNDVLGHPVIGRSWEGFVIESICNALPWPATAFFYRTTVGAEIDLVIQFPDESLWAIEIKRNPAAKLERGFHQALADLKPARAFVVHSGTDTFPLSPTIEATSLPNLLRLLTPTPATQTNVTQPL